MYNAPIRIKPDTSIGIRLNACASRLRCAFERKL